VTYHVVLVAAHCSRDCRKRWS